MTLPSTAIFEVQNGGDDSANGGGFNPSNANMATDLAATSGTGSSPVVTSASYNFQARDVGHWLFIKSGTNWTPGWYQIASVAANAATLSAAAGSAFRYEGGVPSRATTANGCATTGSPSGGTWTIDYSQSTPISFTDLVAATTTTFTSAAKPIGKNFIGNIVSITSGTGWNVTRWEVSSVSGTTGTAANFYAGTTIATAASTGGTGGLGGPVASPGQGGDLYGNSSGSPAVFLKYNAANFVLNNTTINTSGGPVGFYGDWIAYFTGYETHRTVTNSDSNRPTVQVPAAGVSSICVFYVDASHAAPVLRNVIIDGNSKTSICGVSNAGYTHGICNNVKAINCTNYGFNGVWTTNCEGSGCGTNPAFGSCTCLGCTAHGNTAGGFSLCSVMFCLAYGNTGNGFTWGSFDVYLKVNSTAYNNTGDGFSLGGNYGNINTCVAYLNGGYGFNVVSQNTLFNCAAGSNTSGDFNSAGIVNVGPITLTADPFTNAAGGDFSLNTTAGGGAACRAAGFPGAFPGGTTTGYLDIGAVQHQDSGGGTAGMLYHTGGG
jgi:hypothetical protein